MSVAKVFAIDPGIAGTGYAVLEMRGLGRLAGPVLLRAKNIYAPKGMGWQDAADYIVNCLEAIALPYLDQECQFVCEFPTYMAGMHVATAKDSTIKMAFIVGMITRVIQGDSRCGIELVTPTVWKGTMSKGMVERRCRKHVDFSVKAHAIDAIGIGLNYLGRW